MSIKCHRQRLDDHSRFFERWWRHLQKKLYLSVKIAKKWFESHDNTHFFDAQNQHKTSKTFQSRHLWKHEVSQSLKSSVQSQFCLFLQDNRSERDLNNQRYNRFAASLLRFETDCLLITVTQRIACTSSRVIYVIDSVVLHSRRSQLWHLMSK